ncbi:predicted protein [Paecilomyces variotii No. 5]|uniref:Inner kinetochore subunit AME1 domain-containing protein n=1 Tax=Byssochlamys spectabilis (strain No. 5 / NBRC 109023) TaxID=1356009 RepID=V5FZ07_BYSSN|nr:predicted protein [Paecilomyces variotii No. 5]
MASNREERLQMRQRGAGTRQIKAVDFGFSFGLPAAEPEQLPSQPPQPSANLPGSGASSRRSATPNKQLTPPSRPAKATPSSGSHSSQRSAPRSSSSRNHLPERPSTFDIPSDDVPDQGRSAKRRRISPRSESAKSTPGAQRTGQPQPDIVASNDDAQPEPSVSPNLPEKPSTNTKTTYRKSRDNTSTEEPASLTANGTNGIDQDHAEEIQSADTPGSSIQTSKIQRKNRLSTAKERRKSGPTVESSADVNDTRRVEEPVDQPVEAAQPSRSSKRSSKKTAEPQETASPQEIRKRGRAAKTTRNADKNTTKETSPVEESSRQPKRSRKSLGKQREVVQDVESAEERPEADPEEAEEQEEDQASRRNPSKKKGKQQKSAGRPPARGRRSTESIPEDPEASSSRQQRDVDEEEQVEEPAAEASTQRKQSAGKKAAKKAKSRKGKTIETEDTQETGTSAREKKTRGETVPVTVHRLVNVEVLNAAPDSEESADDAESTAKQLSGRSGVNPADVLSQICRETLDKTLTTLKDGIANESNQARRAEWTRKRKAVEAFGTELEGRLFEMSEMLDSNFSLSAQLKKAKRKMADMRSRLLHIRRQREDVALRMDEVRRKHAEDENAKMARNAINNSLHSLELAIDRNKSRNERSSDDEHPSPRTAGLEFMLRAVAENVSSAAPGSQGGLLNQIKSFNAQLERTAKRLEKMA